MPVWPIFLIIGYVFYRQYQASAKLGVVNTRFTGIEPTVSGAFNVSFVFYVSNPDPVGIYFTKFFGTLKINNLPEMNFTTNLNNYLPGGKTTPVPVSIQVNAGTAINSLLDALRQPLKSTMVINGTISIGPVNVPYSETFKLSDYYKV